MPLSIKGSDKSFHDGLVTPLAARSIVLIVALLAVCLPIFLMKALRSKLPPTEGAEKVLRVPSLVQGSHHSLEKGYGKDYQRTQLPLQPNAYIHNFGKGSPFDLHLEWVHYSKHIVEQRARGSPSRNRDVHCSHSKCYYQAQCRTRHR